MTPTVTKPTRRGLDIPHGITDHRKVRSHTPRQFTAIKGSFTCTTVKVSRETAPSGKSSKKSDVHHSINQKLESKNIHLITYK